jgi:hypothetical protein
MERRQCNQNHVETGAGVVRTGVGIDRLLSGTEVPEHVGVAQGLKLQTGLVAIEWPVNGESGNERV